MTLIGAVTTWPPHPSAIMIYFAIAFYVVFGIGYAIGRREAGATVAGAFIAGLIWPLWLGYDLGKGNENQ